MEARARWTLAGAYREQKRFDRAEEGMLAVREFFVSHELQYDVAHADLQLAETYCLQGRKNDALHRLDRAEGTFKRVAAPVALQRFEALRNRATSL